MATTLPKKTRELPRVWKKFWHLAEFEFFDRGGKTEFAKTGLFTAEFEACAGAGGGPRTEWLFPWTRVRTLKLVRDARPGGKSSAREALAEMDTVLEEDNCRNPDGSRYEGGGSDRPQKQTYGQIP